MKDIFISYSRKDSAIAEKFRNLLTEEGWSVFWDVEILPRNAWSDQLEQKLNICKCIVVLWSENSLKSYYVKEEATIGRNAKKLVPIMIDSGIMPPFGFGMPEAVMLNDWDGNKENREYRNLIKAITAHALPKKSTSRGAIQEPVCNTTNTAQSKTPLFAGLGLGLLAILAGAYLFFNTSGTPVNKSEAKKSIAEKPVNLPTKDPEVKPTDNTARDNSAEINRLRKSISDINMSSKKIIDRELQDVGNKKKEIIAPGKFTKLKKTRSDLDARMKQWVANGSNDLNQLKGIEADSKKYLIALNGSLDDIFKVIESISSEAKGLIEQL